VARAPYRRAATPQGMAAHSKTTPKKSRSLAGIHPEASGAGRTQKGPGVSAEPFFFSLSGDQ
jgi:hypothetical protein